MIRFQIALAMGMVAGLLIPAGSPLTAAELVSAPAGSRTAKPRILQASVCDSLRLAIEDLIETFGPSYPGGQGYLDRLDALESMSKASKSAKSNRAKSGSAKPGPTAQNLFWKLRQDALLANPLVDFQKLILLKRKRGQAGLPTNHQCNSCLEPTGYENEIAILSPVRWGGTLETLFRPAEGFYVGEMDLDFDGTRLLFTMPNGRTWQIHEINVDATDSNGTGPRQVSRELPDVDQFDPCWLPDGGIVFASTASFTGVPCWHGKERACSLYRMNADGSGTRQLCFDQDLDLHPAVLSSGQIIYSRWDYTGIMHIYLRPLMVMNPDGSAQRAVYGSNSYYPNALYYPRGIPGKPTKLAAILSGYHGVNRAGELVVLDTTQGWHEADGITHRVGHRGEPAEPEVRDNLVGQSWPKFLHPYPLSEKHFITAAQLRAKAPWGIYLVDVFDNMVPLVTDPEHDYFEPLPVKRVEKPPVIPDRTDPKRDDAVVYMHDVYAGPGLKGVPRGAVKRLRIAAYHFGYPGMAGPDKIGRAGPWDAMRILGTVPVYEDGSASFRVPANTPITVQPLDDEGKALQLMRSWYTAMPGEVASCVGCHETPKEAPGVRHNLASTRVPVDIEPWHGPARGFDFEREVQPVLDRYCVGCHDGTPMPDGSLVSDGRRVVDLRSERFAADYQGLPLSELGAKRLEPELREGNDRFAPYEPPIELLGDRKMRYTPAYEALIPFIRRVNIEDYVGLHVPAEYHADTSELIQMLQKGHYDVRLDDEAWDRLVTWIDLNGPCHGTWGDVSPIPHDADRRRHALAQRFGGLSVDPERVPEIALRPVESISPKPISPKSISPAPLASSRTQAVSLSGWPFEAAEAQRRQRAAGPWQKTLDLGEGIQLHLTRIPAGEFGMGSAETDGEADESPRVKIVIDRDFWISTHEITNEQFARFAPEHDSGLFMKRSQDVNGPGISMNTPKQPVVRVSWHEAAAFCRWLSEREELPFELPSESQWEYACRSGTSSELGWGDRDDDFSAHANLADGSLDRLYTVTGGVVVLQEIPCIAKFDDGAVATADVGGYRPNAWGLFDMHGNAAEWTRSAHRAYPYRDDGGRNSSQSIDDKVVRGGSFHDRPQRSRSAFRLGYPAWQPVHNVGFRVVCEIRNTSVK